jgi:hypothetical protein
MLTVRDVRAAIANLTDDAPIVMHITTPGDPDDACIMLEGVGADDGKFVLSLWFDTIDDLDDDDYDDDDEMDDDD